MLNRRQRMALAGAIALPLLVLATGVLTLVPVDTQSYEGTPYLGNSLERLAARAAECRTEIGPLRAGFGKAPLTPRIHGAGNDPAKGEFPGLPLAGYTKRKGKPATGVHDELHVKAIALAVDANIGVIVSADALIIPPEVADSACRQLAAQAGLGRHQIYFGATHTHAGPGGWARGIVVERSVGPYRPGVREWFSQQIVHAVLEALEDLTPSALGHGSLEAPDAVENRLVGSAGETDDDFGFMIVKQEDGDSIVTGVFSAHATVLTSDQREFSGGYPGYWQRAVESRPAHDSLFLAGGVGSHAPECIRGSFESAAALGARLAQGQESAGAEVALSGQIPFGMTGFYIDMPKYQARISKRFCLRPWVARLLLPDNRRVFLQIFRIDDTLWFSTPCDFSGELSIALENHFRPHGFHVETTSFNGDYIGYVVPSEHYDIDHFETRQMSFFGPSFSDYLLDLMIRSGHAMVDIPYRSAGVSR